MSDTVDLNALRRTIRSNQSKGEFRPAEPKRQVVVDRNGKIPGAEQLRTVQPQEPRSVVPQETFAGRIENDRAVARSRMPRNTREVATPDGMRGWLYSFHCELGMEYQMFAYFDGDYYQVMVLSPKLEDYWNSPHTGHIFSNGRICFGTQYNSGMPSLTDAYAKSVLWANGISLAVAGNTAFPFSINN